MNPNSTNRSIPGGWSNPMNIFRDIMVAIRLLRNPKVPGLLKLLLPVLGMLYFISPDLIPGPIDDVAILILAMRLFLQMAPADAVNEARDTWSEARAEPKNRADDQNTIDTTWHVVDD